MSFISYVFCIFWTLSLQIKILDMIQLQTNKINNQPNYICEMLTINNLCSFSTQLYLFKRMINLRDNNDSIIE